MATFTLSEAEWDGLDDLRFSTNDKRVFRNSTIILMSAIGRSKFSIAQDLGCSPATVDQVRKRYREKGREGMVPVKPTGRPPRATPAYLQALRQAVQTPPQTLGYAFSVWSVGRLQAYLQQQTGIAFSDDQMRRLLHAEGFSFQRPKHTLKGKRNEAEYERARTELETLKKKPWTAGDRSFTRTKWKSTCIPL